MTVRRIAAWSLLTLGLLGLAGVLLLLRVSIVTDHFYHALIKDPQRTPPAGNVLVAPADGRVLYVRRVRNGLIPQVIKRGVEVPIVEHLKLEPRRPFGDGWLVGIYMNSDSVHVNRIPIAGEVVERLIWNGPHMHMTQAEQVIILTQLIPGWVSLRKLLGLPPYDLENKTDFILKSARETLVIEDVRQTSVYVVRIADYTVGKILTWVDVGQRVETGQRLGMITYGSQTDVLFEQTAGLRIRVEPGQFVHGGETVLATY